MAQDITVDLNVPIVNPEDGTPTMAFEDILTGISTTGTNNAESLNRRVNYVRPLLRNDTELLERQINTPRPARIPEGVTEDLERQINYPRLTPVAALRKDIDDLMAQMPRPVPSHSKNSAEIETIMRQMTTQWRALLAPIKQRLDALEAMG